ncbi:unnamed protein product [Caretta caretta]
MMDPNRTWVVIQNIGLPQPAVSLQSDFGGLAFPQEVPLDSGGESLSSDTFKGNNVVIKVVTNASTSISSSDYLLANTQDVQ